MTASSEAAASTVASAATTPVKRRYQILGQLGEGGMGAVFRARDEASGAIVALKQLRIPSTHKQAAKVKALFEREYHTLARLQHPRIIAVYDYGIEDTGPYYTMELLEGEDLQRQTKLPYQKACALLRDVASSLALIHAHRLVHRDVSPANVRVTADGHAKLIDFGALTGFGPSAEIVGTPMCIAPELLRRQALDQRTDLFALGAVAYWILTGRAAFPARSLEELPVLWQQPPAPLSSFVPDIPPALERLVLELLKTDPLARPKSAAAVIDQLTVIADLAPEDEHEQAAESYLLSGRLVGRDHERSWVKRRLLRALSGRGTQVVVEGASGIGKTRLLRELCVDAQLEAMVALSVDAQALPNAYGVASALGLQLLQVAPEVAWRAAGPHAGLLAHLSSELADKLQVSALTELADDPNERRARFQDALYQWFIAIVSQLPVFMAVDNAHLADSESAVFLAALGKQARQQRLVMVIAQRNKQLEADAPMQSAGSGQLRLAGLNLAACEELTKSLFGDVANTGRVAKLLHERSGGNPRTFLDLARLLVRKQIAKYAGGTWFLPLEVSQLELPSQVEEILAERLRELSSAARALCEALCIHHRPVSLDRVLRLRSNAAESQTLAALDELVAEQILLSESGNYRFENDAVREALLQRMEPARRRELHRQAAEMLLETAGGSAAQRVEAAGHLLEAGEERRGADIMANASGEFLHERGADESVEQSVHTLATALDVYQRQGRSDYEIARLLFPLLPLAFFIDRAISLKYGERAVALGLEITGLGLAQRAARYLGKKLGLMVGLIVASVRFARQRKRGLNYSLPEAIGSFCGLVPGTVGTRNICYDIDTVRRLCDALTPLRLFGDKHIACLMHDFARAQLLMGQSREGEALIVLEQLDRDFQSQSIKDALGETHWAAMYGGVLFSLGILYPFQSGTRALAIAEAMDKLGVRVWGMAADQIRMLQCALRGEAERVQGYREKVELYAVQGSTTWQAEMFWPVLLLEAEVLAGDVLAARRIWEQLDRRSKEAPSLVVYAEAAQAAYLALRGELAPAIASYERVLPRLAPRERVAWVSVRADFAATLNLAGEHARARQLMLETLSAQQPGDVPFLARWLEPRRQLALAEAGLGHHAEAVAMLDALLHEHGDVDQPLLVGLLHKARAQLALAMRDGARFAAHAADMERLFRATHHDSLVAQCERLDEQAVRAGLKVRVESGPERGPEPSVGTTTRYLLSELALTAQPRDYALQLIVEKARASGGFLYLYEHESLQLVAATSSQPPAESLVRGLEELAEHTRQLVERAASEDPLDADTVFASQPPSSGGPEAPARTQFVDSVPPATGSQRHQSMLLHSQRGGRSIVLGGVILLHDAQAAAITPEPAFLTAIASALEERHKSMLA